MTLVSGSSIEAFESTNGIVGNRCIGVRSSSVRVKESRSLGSRRRSRRASSLPTLPAASSRDPCAGHVSRTGEGTWPATCPAPPEPTALLGSVPAVPARPGGVGLILNHHDVVWALGEVPAGENGAVVVGGNGNELLVHVMWLALSQHRPWPCVDSVSFVNVFKYFGWGGSGW